MSDRQIDARTDVVNLYIRLVICLFTIFFFFQGLEVKEKGNLARWSLKDNTHMLEHFLY
jgi:hypothetical protein